MKNLFGLVADWDIIKSFFLDVNFGPFESLGKFFTGAILLILKLIKRGKVKKVNSDGKFQRKNCPRRIILEINNFN